MYLEAVGGVFGADIYYAMLVKSMALSMLERHGIAYPGARV